MKILLPVPYWQHTVANGLTRSLGGTNNEIYVAPFSNPPIEKNRIPVDIRQIPFSVVETSLNYEQDHNGEFTGERKDLIEKELNDLSQRHAIDLIIPTSGNFVDFLSRSRTLDALTFLPDHEVVKLARDKYQTGEAMSGLQYVGVPNSEVIDSNQLGKLEKILSQNGGKSFVKPNTAEGSYGAGEVTSVEEFEQKYGDCTDELLVSEVLLRPETNHTIIVRNGEIIAQATYRSRDKDIGVSSRTITVDSGRYSAAAHEIVNVLRSKFGSESIDGVYNIDFLSRPDDVVPVLSEINSGRFPGGHTTYVKAGANLPQFLIDELSGRSPTIPSYKKGVKHQPSKPIYLSKKVA